MLCFAISLLLSVTATPVKYPKPEEISHNPVVDNDIGGDHGAEIDLKYSTYGTKVEEKTSTTPASHQKSNQYYEYSWGLVEKKHTTNLEFLITFFLELKL